MRLLIPWFLLSLVVGYFGRKRVIGFWGFFFFSLVLSPIVGALTLLVGAPRR